MYFNEFNYSENATNDLGIEGRGHYFSNEKGKNLGRNVHGKS